MNCKGKSVNKNQASAQLNRYWHNRTESPHTANAPGFFADREDRDLRRRAKTPATDSARRTSELLKKGDHTLSEQGRAGPWKGGVQTPGLDGRQEAETTIELQLMFL